MKLFRAREDDPSEAGEDHYVVEMRPSYWKMVDVALVLLNHAKHEGFQDVTQYDLVKAVFLADRQRLNDFDRPITYDIYRAMKNGPVPWTFYNMLKGKAAILSKTGPAAWQSRPDPKGGKKVFFHSPERPANRDLFAPNDIKALEGALTFVKNSAHWEVRRRVHRDRAYIAGWNGRKDASSVMDYSLMRDDGDQELVAKLRSDSQHLMPH